MTKYAASTDVSSEKSRAEIERTIRRYGADQFLYAYAADRAMVSFQIRQRQIPAAPEKGNRCLITKCGMFTFSARTTSCPPPTMTTRCGWPMRSTRRLNWGCRRARSTTRSCGPSRFRKGYYAYPLKPGESC